MRLTENEILEQLLSQENLYRPLTIDSVEKELLIRKGRQLDAVIEFSIPNAFSFKAVIEFLSTPSPKVILEKCRYLRSFQAESSDMNFVPIVVAPYIGKKQSKILLEEGVSWIDLSGNISVQVPPNLYIERTGKKNKYPDTAPIKKIYQGTSSLVSRALLLKPEGFSSLYEVVDFINQRNGKITIATVSKVLKVLEEDLLVSRNNSIIYVKQPEQLLENLANGYADYFKRRKNNSYKYDVDSIGNLCALFYEANVDYAFCGFYAAKIKGYGIANQINIFLKSLQDLKKVQRIDSNIVSPDEEYGQVTFIEINNPCVWFNCQGEPFDKIVDDLELYLEMTIDLPRGPKIAKQLKERIIGRFNG